jgi:hypothetical protein
MIDAMTELLADGHGVEDDRIFHDKFTTAADAVASDSGAEPQATPGAGAGEAGPMF